MATFSQGFLANLGRPAMTESLLGVGTAIGNIPAGIENRRLNQQEIAELEGVAPGSAEELVIRAKYANLRGNSQDAVRFAALAETQKAAEANLAIAQKSEEREAIQFAQEQEDRKESKLEKTRAQLDKEIEAEINQSINNNIADALPDLPPGILSAIRQGDPSAKEYAFKFLEKQNIGTDTLSTSRKIGTIKNGGKFYEAQLVVIKNPGEGKPSTVVRYAPLDKSPDARSEPDFTQPIEFVLEGGVTVDEDLKNDVRQIKQRIELEAQGAADKEKAKIYGQRLGSAPQLFQDTQESLLKLQEMERLAGIIESGGKINEYADAINKLLGTTPADKGDFYSLAGEFMVRQLKPIFGGNVSNSEREGFEQFQAGLNQNVPVNLAIIQRLIKDTARQSKVYEYLMSDPTQEEFNGYLRALYPTATIPQRVLKLDADGNLVDEKGNILKAAP